MNSDQVKKNIITFNEDNLKVMATLADESIDVICIDPPYLYLKGQKLEREFDESQFFTQCRRLLTKNGFIILFGRGTSFYRWNCILEDLGFSFKEEFIWDKGHSSSPLMAISRVHETVSVWTKKSGVINKVKVPYLEMKSHNIDAVITDINRLKSTFKNTKSFDAVLAYLEENKIINQTERKHKHSTIVRPSKIMNEDRAGAVMRNIQEGMNEKSIVRSDYYDSSTFTKYSVTADQRKKGDRCVDVINAVHQGMNEKSIINQTRDHFDTIHPTQKPVRLIERLLSLVVPKKPKTEITVADFFAGSMSTMEAVYNMGLTGIAVEIDKEYYLSGKKRLENMPNKQTNLFD